MVGRALTCAAVLVLIGAHPGTSAAHPFPTVPKASCGAGSLPETGLQGQVPVEDQINGRSALGYRCNLELVGQYAGDGAFVMLAWYEDCAYMPTLYFPADPEFETRKGTVVIDASDPAHPIATGRLQTAAMTNPWESLKQNLRRGLIAGGEGGAHTAGPGFDTYDVSKDCTHPELLATLDLPHGSGHEGDFAPDGMTYYQSTLMGPPLASIVAVDVSDPHAPKELLAWQSTIANSTAEFVPTWFHGVTVSDDGNRGYFMMAGGSANGLVVVDLSDIQARRPDPQIRVVSHTVWTDSDLGQLARFARIGGHAYIIATDEFGAHPYPAESCARGESPYGFVHIIDMADETHPRIVSRIALEVNDPAHCPQTQREHNAVLSLMYSSHYCNVDDPHNATAVACTWDSSGLRVFDIRDPFQPREIAYYNPPARLDTVRGSALDYEAVFGARTKDAAQSTVRWKQEPDGSWDLWFVSMENGFQIVKLTNGVYPLR
jgi:hypothetical protein